MAKPTGKLKHAYETIANMETIINNQKEDDNELKAQAIMDFVNIQIGAFESGFVKGREVSLYSMYRFAQHHIYDNYKQVTPLFSEKWGEDLALSAMSYNERSAINVSKDPLFKITKEITNE